MTVTDRERGEIPMKEHVKRISRPGKYLLLGLVVVMTVSATAEAQHNTTLWGQFNGTWIPLVGATLGSASSSGILGTPGYRKPSVDMTIMAGARDMLGVLPAKFPSSVNTPWQKVVVVESDQKTVYRQWEVNITQLDSVMFFPEQPTAVVSVFFVGSARAVAATLRPPVSLSSFSSSYIASSQLSLDGTRVDIDKPVPAFAISADGRRKSEIRVLSNESAQSAGSTGVTGVVSRLAYWDGWLTAQNNRAFKLEMLDQQGGVIATIKGKVTLSGITHRIGGGDGGTLTAALLLWDVELTKGGPSASSTGASAPAVVAVSELAPISLPLTLRTTEQGGGTRATGTTASTFGSFAIRQTGGPTLNSSELQNARAYFCGLGDGGWSLNISADSVTFGLFHNGPRPESGTYPIGEDRDTQFAVALIGANLEIVPMPGNGTAHGTVTIDRSTPSRVSGKFRYSTAEEGEEKEHIVSGSFDAHARCAVDAVER